MKDEKRKDLFFVVISFIFLLLSLYFGFTFYKLGQAYQKHGVSLSLTWNVQVPFYVLIWIRYWFFLPIIFLILTIQLYKKYKQS